MISKYLDIFPTCYMKEGICLSQDDNNIFFYILNQNKMCNSFPGQFQNWKKKNQGKIGGRWYNKCYGRRSLCDYWGMLQKSVNTSTCIREYFFNVTFVEGVSAPQQLNEWYDSTRSYQSSVNTNFKLYLIFQCITHVWYGFFEQISGYINGWLLISGFLYHEW